MTIFGGRFISRRAVTLGSLAVAALLPASAVATTMQAQSPLSSFLIQKGEATGFAPKQSKESTNLPQALEKILRDKGKTYRAELKRFESEGWEAMAYEPLRSTTERNGEGVSTVQRFSTAKGAEEEMSFELKRDTASVSKGTALRHLKVAGVPHAAAFEFIEKKTGEAAANVLFVEGQCFFVVGDFKPSGKQVVAPVIAGAQAIRKRTNGECP